MNRKQVSDYVAKFGRFRPDAPSLPYFVRFPGPYATRTFFADDTYALAEKVYAFTRTKEGRELAKKAAKLVLAK